MLVKEIVGMKQRVSDCVLKTEYKGASSRLLYLILCKNYGSLAGFASVFNVSRQYVNNWITEVSLIPYIYIGRLAREHGIDGRLLRYGSACLIDPNIPSYEKMLKTVKFLSKDEIHYVLEGSHISDINKYYKECLEGTDEQIEKKDSGKKEKKNK